MKKILQLDGRTLAYHIHGEGSEDLVLVHGWMVSGAVFNRLLPLLDTRFRVIIPDHRGAGESASCATYGLEDYVADLDAIAQHAGASSFNLLGHSMGGQIAQLYAATYPEKVKKLALINTVPATGMQLPPEAHELFINAGEKREMLNAILGMATLDLPDGALEELLDDAMTIPADCVRQSYESWTGGGIEASLAKIQATTLVVGTDDPFLPHDFLKAAVVEPINDASFAVVSGAGHYPQVERSSELAALLNDFY
ncbi:alpha/beta hydrolase [Bradymonadaceae bacterium TMQ3]|nr:alpha/beta hydrolase [Bradymonadaceae bacterium TMQ3]TXC76800.1 alpha/beta hydrolase [Bradymonadales bacterium TMQ1]